MKEAIFESFEEEWRTGQRPMIEELLENVPADQRPRFLFELLNVELRYRQQAGETVEQAEYWRRFPRESVVVSKAFAELYRNIEIDSPTQYPVPEPRSRQAVSVIGPYQHLQKIGAEGLSESDTINICQEASTGETDVYSPHTASDVGVALCLPGYQITSEIAKGGMGRVYTGLDLTLDREIAIKTLLPGANIKRFIVEAKITARLPHPGIPPVYAMGTMPDGTPWLAMKLVRGETLAVLLNQRIDPQEDFPRFIQIFEQVAQAVGFAHSREILHRDLKPLNIMVGEFGEVQVMDWGLAKDQAGRELEMSFHPKIDHCPDRTAFGTIMGTPGYMAPEQARGEVLDARADVFALGSILAAILTGQPAFVGKNSRDTILKAAAGDLSDVLARLDACAADEELILLTTRCLAVEREYRPADARQVASEIASYRVGVERRLREAETERARAETQAEEQVRRRRIVQWAGSIIAVVLLVGLSVSLWQWKRASVAEADAVGQRDEKERQRKVAEEQRSLALIREEQANQSRVQSDLDKAVAVAVRRFLQNQLLRPANPWEQVESSEGIKGNRFDLTVRELFDQASQEFSPQNISQKFPDQSLVQSEILATIGDTFLGLGEFPRAIQFIEASQTLREKELGPLHPLAMTQLIDVIIFHVSAGQHSQALRVLDQLFTRFETLLNQPSPPTSGEADIPAEALSFILDRLEFRLDPARSTLPVVDFDLGKSIQITIQLGLLIPRVQRVHQLCLDRYGEDSKYTLLTYTLIGFANHTIGKTQAACEIYEKVLAMGRIGLSTDHPLLLGLREVLEATYIELGVKPEATLKLAEELFATWERILGPGHPRTIERSTALAKMYAESGRVDEAIRMLEQSHALCLERFGPDLPYSLAIKDELALAYKDAGRTAEALLLYQEALRLRESRLGPYHPDTLSSMNRLALAYDAGKRLEHALPLFQTTWERRKATLGSEHPDTLISQNNLALAYDESKQLDKALPLFEETLQLRKTTLGPGHTDTINSLHNLAVAYDDSQKYDKAQPLYRELLEFQRKRLGATHPETLNTMSNLANSFRSDRKFNLAVPLYEETLRLMQDALGCDHLDTINMMRNLASSYQLAGKGDLALPLFVEMLRLRREKLGSAHPDTLFSMNSLAKAYLSDRKFEEALRLYEEILQLARTHFGSDHSYALTGIHNLAFACQNAGQVERAVVLFEESVEVHQRVLGRDHADTLMSMNGLANCFRSAGKIQQAISLGEGTLLRSRTILGSEHPVTLSCLDNLGWSYCAAKHGEDAVAVYSELIAVQRRRMSAENSQFASLLSQTAERLIECDQLPTAEEMLGDCLALREKMEPEAWITYYTKSMLGATILDQGRYADSLEFLIKGYQGLRSCESRIPPQAANAIPEVLDRLIELYTLLDNPEEVAKYRTLRDQYPPPEKTP